MTSRDPTGAAEMSSADQDRFWSKTVVAGNCVLWTGAKVRGGYGVFRVGGHMRYVHRLAYELIIGPIPPGMDLDHVRARGCVSRACILPDHLEPVTHAENCRRAVGLGAYNARKTHCPQGHEYSAANTYTRQGSRTCRACAKDRAARRRKAAV